MKKCLNCVNLVDRKIYNHKEYCSSSCLYKNFQTKKESRHILNYRKKFGDTYARKDFFNSKKYLIKKDSKCNRCGRSFDLVLDHVVPISKGGSWDEKNYQILCKDCNKFKGSKVLDYRNKENLLEVLKRLKAN